MNDNRNFHGAGRRQGRPSSNRVDFYACFPDPLIMDSFIVSAEENDREKRWKLNTDSKKLPAVCRAADCREEWYRIPVENLIKSKKDEA